MTLVIRGARLVVGDGTVLPRTDIHVRDGKIATVSPNTPISSDNVIEAFGRVVMPGFVDAHTHALWAGSRLDEFEQLKRGVPYLEMDCHATRDGEIVVLHDAELERTTDGAGPVSSLSYAELSRLDAGHRFCADGRTYPFRGAGIRVPRLADVLAAFPDARINLEVKQADPPIAEEVVRLVRRARAEGRVLLAAEHEPVLAKLRALENTGLSSEDDIRDIRWRNATRVFHL